MNGFAVNFEVTDERKATLHRKAFTRVYSSFHKYYSVKDNAGKCNNKRPIKIRTQHNIERVKQQFEENPTTSITAASRELNISRFSTYMIVKKYLKMHPFKHIRAQALSETHKAERMLFCQWYLDQPNDYGEKVIWSDEKLFVMKPSPSYCTEFQII